MRLQPGQNEKIDEINRWVELARLGDNDAMANLLEAFHPLILKICRRWSIYFNDEFHHLKPMDSLIIDTQYWMWYYTQYKYTTDGEATYNNFIRKHLIQRVRYMFEEQLNYNSKLIMPDPDKNNITNNDKEMFDDVIFNYGSVEQYSMDDMLIDQERESHHEFLVGKILSIINDIRYFSQRDAYIFNQCICNGRTHTDMARELGISRTRISQMLHKIKCKIRINVKNFVKEDII